jgi:hypothetical protein
MTLSRRDQVLLIGVFCIALLQVIGFGLGNKIIRGMGIVSASSPLPFVFSAHNGLETFAQRYAVEIVVDSTPNTRVEIDHLLYSQLGGAYNFRNAYGAIFSHGPVIEKMDGGSDLIDAIATYGFCSEGELLAAFELDLKPLSVILESRPQNQNQETWRHQVDCP